MAVRFNRSFTASTVEPGFEPIPEGIYTARVTECAMEPNANGNGDHIKFVFTIEAPEFAGRTLFHYNNTFSTNERAAEIGEKELSWILNCIGVQRANGPDDFIGHACSIKVIQEPDYKDATIKRNRIKKFSPLSNVAPKHAVASSTPAPAEELPQTSAVPQCPWER